MNKTARAFIILFILYAFASTVDFMSMHEQEVTPCDTDYECQQLNPHITPY